LRTEKPRTGTLSKLARGVGLGLVTLLILGMIGLDVYFSNEEAHQTTEILENAQRSILLLKDILLDAKQLATSNDARSIERWKHDIEEDARHYDPLATYTGEREEWNHLQDLLAQLPAKPADHPQSTRVLEERDRQVRQ
jgi:hypothetical protein